MVTLIGDKEGRPHNSPFTVRVDGTDLQETAWSPDEAIGQLALKHEFLWGGAINNIEILVGREDYMACLRADNQVFAYGATEAEAMGALIRTYMERFETHLVVRPDGDQE